MAYVERVNRAIDFVITHLDEPLRLEQVARAASLSAFHFHRVFRALVGTTLAEFIQRLRFDKALTLMARGKRPSLTSIALACGFSSSAEFSRAFKQRFTVAPSRFDIAQWSATHQAHLRSTTGAQEHLHRLPVQHNPDSFRVTLRHLPARTVAYIRVRNPYRGDAVLKAAQRLVAWAERHALANGQWLGYQWDNPEIVSLVDCQYHVAVEADRFDAKGEIGRFQFPPMMIAEVGLSGGIDLEIRALQWLYGTWLPRSAYLPDDQPCFEAWIGRPFAHGNEHFELRVQLPVRPLS